MNRKRGFTLLELVIVIVIIGILATLAISNVVGQTAKARDGRRKSDLAAIQRALELYYSDNNAYPNVLKTSGSSMCHPNGCATQNYMQKVPDDPKGTTYYYCHTSSPNPEGYRLLTTLEYLKDTQIFSPSFTYCVPMAGYNWGLTSPNLSP